MSELLKVGSFTGSKQTFVLCSHELYAESICVKEMLDAEVDGPAGAGIGYVENVFLRKNGYVLSVLAEVRGFLDIGDTGEPLVEDCGSHPVRRTKCAPVHPRVF